MQFFNKSAKFPQTLRCNAHPFLNSTPRLSLNLGYYRDQSSNQQGLEILQRPRNIFAQDPKGKGEMIKQPPNRNEIQSSPDAGFHGGVGTQYTLPVIPHQPYEQSTSNKDTVIQKFPSKADKGIPNHYQQIIGEKSSYTYSHQGPPLLGNVTGVVQDYPTTVKGVKAGDISINPVLERHLAKEMMKIHNSNPIMTSLTWKCQLNLQAQRDRLPLLKS
jgi:hypothetical protein